MRARELLTEATVGREYQHLEDLVFAEGSKGAKRAATILQRLGQRERSAWKSLWDKMAPAVVVLRCQPLNNTSY